MNCDQAMERMVSAWKNELGIAVQRELEGHLAECAACRAESEILGAMWVRMGDLPVPEPGPSLDARWQSTLNSQLPKKLVFWPKRTEWQMALAAACLIAGLLAGMEWQRSKNSGDEIARLRQEVASTREMVALSLLGQQSPTERLRGVDYSTRMPRLEPDVVAALIQAVANDQNVNVRLAAIDALTRLEGDARVRGSLVQTLGTQDSPMVQAALIDYFVEARDRQAAGAVKQLLTRPDLNPAVRTAADSALRTLNEYR